MAWTTICFTTTLVSAALLCRVVDAGHKDKERDDYEYDYDYDRDAGYGGGGHGGGGGGGLGGGINPLAALIAPLAALALLGAAAAVAINPILVQLAVVSGRKRRDLTLIEDPEVQRQLREVELLDNFLAKEPETAKTTSEQLLASYLDCSGFNNPDQNQCLEYLACLYSKQEPSDDPILSPEEKHVVSIILYNLLTNRMIGEDTKDRVKDSARTIRSINGSCKKFFCPLVHSKKQK